QSRRGKKNLPLVEQLVAMPWPDHGSGKFLLRPEAYRCGETLAGFRCPEVKRRSNLPKTRESIPGRDIPLRHRKSKTEKCPSREGAQIFRAMHSIPRPRQAQ